MATLVKFLLENDGSGDIYAYFPQLNYNKRLYGNTKKMVYAHIGQHSGCCKQYAAESSPATKIQYSDLLAELSQVGYMNLKTLNKS
jgi:hypothetical protein